MRIALATFAGVPEQFDDDRLLADAIARRGGEVELLDWGDPSVDWARFDRVVIRSTWDYTFRLDAFLAWAESLDGRLRNPPELVRWNTDKRYLGELEAAGLPVVPTRYVVPGDPAPALAGELVVKPTVSAGGRDTGRFGPDHHERARALIERIRSSGRTAMVQPYLDAVDREGETAIVFIAGELAHSLGKRAVLAPDQVAPVRDDELGAAEAMYDSTLVSIATADREQVELGRRVVAHLAERFGATPLIARVDVVRDREGLARVLELEAVEPSLYLSQAPETTGRLADAILGASRRR